MAGTAYGGSGATFEEKGTSLDNSFQLSGWVDSHWFLGGEFQHYLYHARGSLYELEIQLIIAENLGYLIDQNINHIKDLMAETGRILNGPLASIKKKIKA